MRYKHTHRRHRTKETVRRVCFNLCRRDDAPSTVCPCRHSGLLRHPLPSSLCLSLSLLCLSLPLFFFCAAVSLLCLSTRRAQVASLLFSPCFSRSVSLSF